MDLGLQGKRAIVTGGSRGIGLAIAKGLAAEGCTLGLIARGREGLERAREELVAGGARQVEIEAADVTDSESAGRWRELLAGTGVRRASLSGSGIFRDAAADATVRGLFFDGTIRNWQVVIPDFGTVTGAFHVSGLEYGGEHDGEVTFEIALESAGALAFSAL